MMTLESFKEFHQGKGLKYFSSMKDLQSRIHEYDVYSGLFITSEVDSKRDTFRRYTLRQADFKTGEVKLVSKLMEFQRPVHARALMKKLKLKKDLSE